MKCADIRPMSESYLAGELPVDTHHAILTHLDACAACRDEFDARDTLRRTLRRAVATAPSLTPDPAFIARVTAQARGNAGGRRPFGLRGHWLAIAAGLVLVVFAAWQIAGALTGAPRSIAALAEHAAGDHRYCALEHALEETPISLAEAGRQFDPAYAALLTVVDESPAAREGSIAVVGGHWCVFRGRRFAHVVVRQRERLVSVLLTPLDAPGARLSNAVACPVTDGFQVACFGAKGHTGFVVSDLSADENLALARVLAPFLQAYFDRA